MSAPDKCYGCGHPVNVTRDVSIYKYRWDCCNCELGGYELKEEYK